MLHSSQQFFLYSNLDLRSISNFAKILFCNLQKVLQYPWSICSNLRILGNKRTTLKHVLQGWCPNLKIKVSFCCCKVRLKLVKIMFECTRSLNSAKIFTIQIAKFPISPPCIEKFLVSPLFYNEISSIASMYREISNITSALRENFLYNSHLR